MAKGDRGPADFVARVVSDPKNPPETRLLSGWLGDAGEDGYQRLYTTAELNAYVDIPTDAVLHTEAIGDAQPAGAVFVWVKADAELRWGGSAASRAASFLQGQVQQDFASGGGGGGGGADPKLLEKLGYRCVTEVPCAEPTGFSGLCTKQPEVGGGWPCITLIPHCAEPTGFTGKCTHLPWPNPTEYFACTQLHCPTFDLTCIPRICNIVATGLPGCQVDDPRGGGGEAPRAAAAGAEAVAEPGSEAQRPVTHLLGCGFTKIWGACETRLLGCGFTQPVWCPRTVPPRCQQQIGTNPTLVGCNPTLVGCNETLIGCFPTLAGCFPTLTGCNPTLIDCGLQGGGVGRRAAAVGPIVTHVGCDPSAVDACPSQTRGCHTQPPTALCTQFGGPQCPTPETTCTQVGPQCPTACGFECQSQQLNCTQVGEICLTRPVECTHFDPKCPSIGIACTAVPPCPVETNDCTFGCTLAGTGCPASQSPPVCPPPPHAAAAAVGPTGFQGCTQGGPQCPTVPSGDCTFFGNCPTQGTAPCPSYGQPQCTLWGPACPPTPATVCTLSGPQCPSKFECTMVCTQVEPQCQHRAAAAAAPAAGAAAFPITQLLQCHPTPATVCFVCPPRQTLQPWQCAPTPATRCLVCPPLQTAQPWQCAPTPATRCLICPPLTRNVFQCGGPSAVDACPTRLCGGAG